MIMRKNYFGGADKILGFPPEIPETNLAHVTEDKAPQAYRSSDPLEKTAQSNGSLGSAL